MRINPEEAKTISKQGQGVVESGYTGDEFNQGQGGGGELSISAEFGGEYKTIRKGCRTEEKPEWSGSRIRKRGIR